MKTRQAKALRTRMRPMKRKRVARRRPLMLLLLVRTNQAARSRWNGFLRARSVPTVAAAAVDAVVVDVVVEVVLLLLLLLLSSLTLWWWRWWWWLRHDQV